MKHHDSQQHKMASPYTCIPLFILNFLLLSSSVNSSGADFIKTVMATRTEKTSHLHFYFQDRADGQNPTVVKIIGGQGRKGFGMTFMIDDALTRRAERDSEVVGRAQGMYSFASQNDIALLMMLTFYFSQGKYNGSSLSMMGRNHVGDEEREMPIVGGSGLFRLARGYALAHTIWFDAQTKDATVEYNVSVVHF